MESSWSAEAPCEDVKEEELDVHPSDLRPRLSSAPAPGVNFKRDEFCDFEGQSSLRGRLSSAPGPCVNLKRHEFRDFRGQSSFSPRPGTPDSGLSLSSDRSKGFITNFKEGQSSLITRPGTPDSALSTERDDFSDFDQGQSSNQH